MRKLLPLCALALFACSDDAATQKPQVVPGGDNPSGCGQIDYLGVCVGTEAVFCFGDRLDRVDCGDRGCGWVNDDTGYFCGGTGFRPADPGDLPPAGRDDACDGVPPEGRCDGDLLVWCQGRVRARDCEKEGLECGWHEESGRNDCLGDPEPGTPDMGGRLPDDPPAILDAGTDPPPPPPPDPDMGTPPPPPPPPDGEICYTEEFNDGADLGAVRNRYRQDRVGALRQALTIRWPGGEPLTHTPQAFLNFLDSSSWSNFFDSAATVMHESSHGFHADNGLWQQRTTYYIRGDYHIAVDVHPTPARSLIRPRVPDNSTEIYHNLYMVGEQGSRGFFDLMEELNCYVQDFVTYAAFGDEFDILGVSGRDGAVAFFLFVQIYLNAVRTEQPQVHAQICGQAAVREYLDVEWRRLHFWMPVADRYPELGIRDGDIRRHLYQADRMAEFEHCLGFPLYESNCRDRQPGE